MIQTSFYFTYPPHSEDSRFSSMPDDGEDLMTFARIVERHAMLFTLLLLAMVASLLALTLVADHDSGIPNYVPVSYEKPAQEGETYGVLPLRDAQKGVSERVSFDLYSTPAPGELSVPDLPPLPKQPMYFPNKGITIRAAPPVGPISLPPGFENDNSPLDGGGFCEHWNAKACPDEFVEI